MPRNARGCRAPPAIPANMAMRMAPNGNPAGMRMWPSLSISLPLANKIADFANLLFFCSLVVGVVSTGTIIWMTGIKEGYWEADRRASAEKIAGLTTQGDQLRKQTAEANARAAEAQLALERLKTPRTLGPARQEVVTNAVRRFAGQRYRAAISQGADDGIAFWESLYTTLERAGWIFIPSGPPSVGNPPAGIPIAAVPGVEIRFDPAKERQLTPAALALGNALHSNGTVVAVNRDGQSSPKEADQNILLIVIGARVPPQ